MFGTHGGIPISMPGFPQAHVSHWAWMPGIRAYAPHITPILTLCGTHNCYYVKLGDMTHQTTVYQVGGGWRIPVWVPSSGNFFILFCGVAFIFICFMFCGCCIVKLCLLGGIDER